MEKKYNQPREYDAVLGGQTPAPADAAVLGGLQGVKSRLASPLVEARTSALVEALKYGEAGLDLAIQSLKDEFWKVRQTAHSLLQHRNEPRVKQALEEFADRENRFDRFVARATAGKPSDIDTLMRALETDGNTATCKLVDYVLGLVTNSEGKTRIQHYLFEGTPMQRNYAALYFKRKKETAVLTEAFRRGCIDKVQAFSK